MRSLNKVFLMGNLGADPDVRYDKEGRPRAVFSVATSRMRKQEEDDWVQETEWHRVVTFGKVAERCQSYLRKGSGVLVEGRSQRRSWEDPERGRQWIHEVIAYDVVFLRLGVDRRPDGPSEPAAVPGMSRPKEEAGADLPF